MSDFKTTDFTEKIMSKRAEKGELMKQAQIAADEGRFDDVEAITAKMAGINKEIGQMENCMDEANRNAVGAYDGVLHTGEGKTQDKKEGLKLFNSLGEQLKAIHAAATDHTVDERLRKVNNAALGANESVGSDGGFLIQTDFAGAIIESAVQNSPLLNRLDRYTCSSEANAMRWVQVDETDVSSSVFGGVQMYWAAEAATVNASKPKFTEMKMDLEKMMGYAYCTDEMLTDAAFMSGFFGRAFSLAADRLLLRSVIDGDGVSKPLGILHSGATIEVAKETGQAAGTFVGANAIKMQARALPRNRQRMCWVMHPDLEEQLPLLSITSGQASKFLWDPEGGLGNLQYQRVLGKDVIFEDACSALGTKGDVMLIDPMQYILLTKGTAKQDWSIHVQFLTDQNCFRMVFRCNGAPKMAKPITINNSTKTRSGFVTLATRA